MTNPNDLLPCPFCGEAQPPHDDTSWIRCVGCGSETGWQATGGEAIAAWNRRALPAVTDPQIATLQAERARLVDALRATDEKITVALKPDRRLIEVMGEIAETIMANRAILAELETK
jgi:Lar family restriction alleviation protein